MTQATHYRGRVRIGVDAAGKPIDKYLTAPTKLELETVKQACREHFILGRPVPEDRMFYEYAEEWYTIRKEPFISDASRASYKSAFIRHVLPEFGLQHMKAISANDIQLFVNRFAGSSKSQITMVIGILRGIFSTAYAEGLIERDPTVVLIRPKSSKKDARRPLTDDETQRVLEVIDNHPGGCSWRCCITSASAGARRWGSSGATSISPRTRCTFSATWTTPARSPRMAA